jgi:uncharacterized protein YmfQ (DUF2313 family)
MSNGQDAFQSDAFQQQGLAFQSHIVVIEPPPIRPLPPALLPPELAQDPEDEPLQPDRHVRRGQEEYTHALSALLPQGIAWPRWPETILMQVVNGLAASFGWCDGRAADMLERESDPRQTVEMLDQWERAWGLPDPCYQGPISVHERQIALVLRITMLGAQSREFFYSVAEFLGYKIAISEYRPFMVGVDRCGDNRQISADGVLSDWPCQIGSSQMRFYWTVHLQQPKLVWFRAGSGQSGIDPHLRIARAADLECVIHRWEPGHTQALFDYSGIDDPYAGAGRYYITLRSGDYVSLRDNTTEVTNERPISIFWPQAPTSYYTGSPTFATPLMLVALAPSDPSTTVWYNTIIMKGGTVSDQRLQQIDLLIKRLKADGVWPVLDRLWMWDGDSEVEALVDLVAGAIATNAGSGFQPKRGYSGAYINSNFNPVTAGGKYIRNSAGLGAWVLLGGSGLPYNIIVSSLGAAANSYIDIDDGGSSISYFAINDAKAGTWAFSTETLNYGMFAVNRNGSTNSQAYYNGIEIQFCSNTSAAPPSSPITFNGGMGGYYSDSQLVMGYISGGMTVAQQRALYNDLRSYFIAMNVPVGTPPSPPL